jgi:hypothetical protein
MNFTDPVRTSDGSYYAKYNGETLSSFRVNGFRFDTSESVTVPIEHLKDEIIEYATEHSMKWFSKKIPRDTLSGMYDDELDYILDENVTFFDESRVELPEAGPPKNTLCDILVELDGVWFIKKSFGPRWRVTQGKIVKPVKECKL